jgi:hypothetical protein|tara:strand:+ start:1765 stop:1986 length:222 start_codon:yes stop_codon:yes gene_type:complete
MKYVIYEISEIDKVDFTQVSETSENTLRLSANGEQTVLKFVGDTPDFLVGLQQYNHSEILEIMATPEWNKQQD